MIDWHFDRFTKLRKTNPENPEAGSMTFIHTLELHYVNLDKVAKIGPAFRNQTGSTIRRLYDYEGDILGNIADSSIAETFTAIVTAPPGWRFLRAWKTEAGQWDLASNIPVIAFGMALDGFWKPVAGDCLLSVDTDNPIALKHDDETAVYDGEGSMFATIADWLLYLGDEP